MARPGSDFDTSWKEALEALFPEALALLFPEVNAGIDWARGFEFLDQELRQAVRRARRGLRVVDKLAKVWRRNGEEAWVLVHVEVQSQPTEEFPEGMYVANSLLFARHRRPVASLGVLGDARSDWRPDHFGYALWGSEASLRFPVVKLLDYVPRWDELEQSANPFAVVVMAHLKTLQTARAPESRMQSKLRLVRMLHERGYTEERIRLLFRFMDLMMTLPDDLEEQFTRDLSRYEKERKMPVLTQFEKLAIKKGLQKGMQEGRQEGALEMARQMLMDAIAARFGRVPPALADRVAGIGEVERLRELNRKAVAGASLEEIEQALASPA